MNMAARAGLAAIFMERGEFDFAEKEYQAALVVDPADAAAKTGLATVAKARDAAKAAQAAAEAWLALLDAGEYGQTWDQASALVKKVTTKAGWESTVKSAVAPLGKPGARKVTSATYMTSMPGAPDGEYVIVQFRTAYEKKKDAVEVVTPMKDTDGKWRVSGYYIR
jgi:tetratricopeptide (TPR) repeat protein